jgi:hypothetical protein
MPRYALRRVYGAGSDMETGILYATRGIYIAMRGGLMYVG